MRLEWQKAAALVTPLGDSALLSQKLGGTRGVGLVEKTPPGASQGVDLAPSMSGILKNASR